MKILAVVALCVALTLATPLEEWKQWKQVHGKRYTALEEAKRFGIYLTNTEKVEKLNKQARAEGRNTTFAMNKFSDIDSGEFSHIYMGYKASNSTPNSKRINFGFNAADSINAAPTSWDWRSKGLITPIKNQEQCGSCWAFSTTEGVESAWIKAGHGMVVLSEQQIVSCDKNDAGCGGGDLPTALAYVEKAGLETEAAYPYTSGGGDDGTCHYNSAKVVARIKSWHYATTTGNERQMVEASYANGPLSICVDASTWQFYNGGIIKNNCGKQLDHCVQIVGWAENGVPYWIVRNSWGGSWGIDGYIYVERNSDLCGIAQEAVYILA